MAHQFDSHDPNKQTTGVTIGNVDDGIHGSTIVGRDLIQHITNVISGGSDEQRAQRDKRVMLKLVKSFWVKGVLEQSLHGEALIELGLEERARAVEEQPWDMLLQVPGQTNRPLPHNTKIADVFEEMNQALLILGEPGSGKTTMLLELTRDTIARAETDPTQPIPVVFNLSSWADTKQPIANWLIDELNSKYNIPKKIGRRWVQNDDLLLLFDGLDEVRREAREDCVKAINSFRQEHLMQMVVCSRVSDYDALTVQLKLHGAVLIQSLTPEQITEYLKGSGRELSGFNEILLNDTSLQELAQSPLMLSIMTLAYRGMSSEDLQSLDSVEARRRHLFEAYVRQMFQRRGTNKLFSPEQATHWLAWLARQLSQHAQTIFLIEGLQPSWLATSAQKWIYVLGTRLIFGLICGILWACALGGNKYGWLESLSFGLAAGLAIGIVDGLRFNKKSTESGSQPAASPRLAKRIRTRVVNIGIVLLSIVLVGGIGLGLVSYLLDRWRFGMGLGDLRDHLLRDDALGYGFPIAVIFGLRRSRQAVRRDIQPVENVSWSWRRFALVFVIIGLLPGSLLWGYFRTSLSRGVTLWSAQDGSRIAQMGIAAGSANAVALSPDGNRLVVATNDERLRILEAPKGTLIAELAGDKSSNAIHIDVNPQSTRIVIAEPDWIRLLDARDYSLVAELKGHKDWVRSANFNLDGSRILTVDRTEARLWNGENGAHIATIEGDFERDDRQFVNIHEIELKKSISKLDWFKDATAPPKFSSDGTRVLIVTHIGEIKLWSASDGSSITTLQVKPGRWRAADISPDGKRIVTVGYKSPPFMLDAKTFSPLSYLETDSNWLRDWTPVGGFEGDYSVIFSEDGSRFAILANNHKVWLGDGKTWAFIRNLETNTRELKDLHFSADATRLLAEDQEGRVALWDVQTGKLVATVSPTIGDRYDSQVAFSQTAPRFVTSTYIADLRGIAFYVALLGLTLGIFAGLRQGVVSLKALPNQGITLSIKYAMMTFLGFGLVVAVATALSFLQELGGRGINSPIKTPLVAGAIIGSIAGLWYGGFDVIQHYFLRSMLYVRGDAPWNYGRFLDYAARRVFLRKVGGGYIFVHRLLLDYFAGLKAERQ
jgi:WD40 repeat protein